MKINRIKIDNGFQYIISANDKYKANKGFTTNFVKNGIFDKLHYLNYRYGIIHLF